MAGVSATSTLSSRWRSPRPFTVSRCLCLVAVSPFTRVTLILLPDVAGFLRSSLISRPYPAISSTFLPRLAAISEGRRCCVRPSSVARTTLYGLVEPWHLAEMLVTPITSNTARMAPPALMPLPSCAGFIITLVAPWRPSPSWWMVPLFSAIFTMLRRACSIAFCTATGTSRALPLPMPIEPSPSPTTVRAAKPRMRPPLTTLVTRFTEIIFSRRPSLFSSDPAVVWSIFAMSRSSELQSARAGGFGERFHAAVIAEPRAVESDLADAGCASLLGDALAHFRRRRLLGAVGVRGAHLLLQRRGRSEHLLAGGVDQLGVDVQVGPVDHQARRALARDAHPRLRGTADSRGFLVHGWLSLTSSWFP